MAGHLEGARTILERREIRTKKTSAAQPTILLLNEIQCNSLWRTIRAVYNYLSSSQLPYPNNRRHKYLPMLFREFYVLVARADAVQQEFEAGDPWLRAWLRAAILQGNNQLAFKDLTLDLQACVRVFHESTGHIVPVDASAAIWRQDVDTKSDARRDAENLRNRVEDLLARPALREESRLLAEYLLKREKTLSTIENQDHVELPQFFLVKGGYPTMGKPIGHGASGAVLQVEWLGMTCAMKHFSATEDEGLMKECLKEMSVLAKLNHPHIVKLLCTSEQSEVSFVMELMPMSLADFIKERWGSPEGIVPAAAIDMMLQLARGMEYLHEQGIVHRDLKSFNILVAPSKKRKLRKFGYADVKLTDFGLAKMKVHDLTKPTHKMMGTTKWRAPEAYAADLPIDWKKADVYSFAMTCSEILTGKTPFSPGLLPTLYARIMRHERPKLPSSCPKNLASLLGACWHTKPSARPSFTEIIKTLTSVKRDLLKYQWNDPYPGKAHRKLGTLQGLRFMKAMDFNPPYNSGPESDEGDIESEMTWGKIDKLTKWT